MRSTPLSILVKYEGKAPMLNAIEKEGLGHLNREFDGYLGDVIPGQPGTAGVHPPGWQPNRYQSNTYQHHNFYRPGYDGHPSTYMRQVSAHQNFHGFAPWDEYETYPSGGSGQKHGALRRRHRGRWGHQHGRPWGRPGWRGPWGYGLGYYGHTGGVKQPDFFRDNQNVIIVSILLLLVFNLFLTVSR